MKNFFRFAAVLVTFMCYSACTKDRTNPPVSVICTGVDSATNTYNLQIKAIMDLRCGYGGCHDAGTASGSVILDSYADTKAAFISMDALCTIKQAGSCLPMPQGGAKLADSLITYIQCWGERGYPQ